MKKVPGTLKRVLKKVRLAGNDSSNGDPNEWDKDFPPQDADIETANVVTSLLEWPEDVTRLFGECHAPVIDLDIPHTYVPSTTPGHGHLYIDLPMQKHEYFTLLKALHEAGILEFGSYQGAVNRGWSAVRLPWIKKDKAPEPEPFEPGPGDF